MQQKNVFKRWIGTARYVYNKALEATKKGAKMNFYDLRNKFVTAKNNSEVTEWESETPKDVRSEAVNDVVKAFKTAISNLKNGNINHFKLNFRSKKKESSIAIPHTAVKVTLSLIHI